MRVKLVYTGTGKHQEVTRWQKFILKTDNPEGAIELVKSAIASEIFRLERSQQLAKKRLDYFEGKYQQPSSQLRDKISAEDMEGGDLEYVEWAGEYQFF